VVVEEVFWLVGVVPPHVDLPLVELNKVTHPSNTAFLPFSSLHRAS
jgi:hypothetical protein